MTIARRITSEQADTLERTYLGYWQGSEWWLIGGQTYRETLEGLHYEGSYEWFSRAASDRLNHGEEELEGDAIDRDPIARHFYSPNREEN